MCSAINKVPQQSVYLEKTNCTLILLDEFAAAGNIFLREEEKATQYINSDLS